ncbi:MAG: 1-acyl-sn-glycerol-3-phosphate acyltransferase [Ignavibacteriales bacterium]|nr:1-acyl-sn-glycerol-3-phosphate acyltransferase [Ignavibacteriales bacterium]
MIVGVLKAFLVILAALPYTFGALLGIPFQKNGEITHAMARGWSRFILWIYGVRVHVRGAENIQQGKNYVYASNHASMFDIPTVIGSIPDQIRLVLKKELTRIPFWGWALKYGGYISIDRSNAIAAQKSLEAAAEKIRKGTSVLLFAEGTRTKDGKLQPFKRGAFALAAQSGVPILPVTINNSFRILPKGSLTVRPQDIELIIDKQIPTEGIDGRDAELKLMERVRRVVEKNFVEQP